MKKVLKSTKGITLIALVVTIIVLLILAGVSINTLLGKNGILTSAQDAGDKMKMAVLKDKIETSIVNWKADSILDSSVTEERFWEDLEEAGIISSRQDVSAPASSTDSDGTKKDIYEVDTTDECLVDIIVTTEPDGEKNISVGNIVLNTSKVPKIYIVNLEANDTNVTVTASVRRLNDGKITYLYREQGTDSWTEIKKDTTDLTATVTGLTSGKTYEFKASVTNSDGFDETDPETIELGALVTSITLDKTSASVAEGSTMQLTATVSPENATNKELEWKSSNTGVATVDQNGKVTTLAEGTTTITVTAKDGSGVKAECKITATMSPSNYTWSQNKTTVTGTHKTISGKTITYEVGQTYTYNAGVSGGYTGSWGILGAGATGTSEAGKLLIMTTSNVVDSFGLKGKTGDGTSDYTGGYNNGIAKLNEVCVQKCGTGARSINVDDINRVTGYNPAKTGDGNAFSKGAWDEYGNVVTYTSSGATASNGNTNTSGLYNSVYYHPNGKQIGGTGGTQVSSITETSTYYYYYPYSLTTSNAITGTCNGIKTDSKAYEMIFGTYANTSAGTGNKYWLASSCVRTYSNDSSFCMRYVNPSGYVYYYRMWFSSSTSDYGTSMAVRSVVSL